MRRRPMGTCRLEETTRASHFAVPSRDVQPHPHIACLGICTVAARGGGEGGGDDSRGRGEKRRKEDSRRSGVWGQDTFKEVQID